MTDTASRASSMLPGDFLGHPRGLSFLFATEMWERAGFFLTIAGIVTLLPAR